MITAYRTNTQEKYRLVYNNTLMLPPNINLTILKIKDKYISEASIIVLRLIFSTQGENFTVSVKKPENRKSLDYYFYNWDSEEFTEPSKPFRFTYQENEYLFNFSTKINTYINQRTIQITLWAIL